MRNIHALVRDAGITMLLLSMFFGICLFLQGFFDVHALIPMIFTLAVFLVSKFTSGYFLGIMASLVSVLAVNYAFTFPHFRFNFTITENLTSALIMLIVTIMTSTMTTQIKKNEQKKREIASERIRANLLRAISHDLRTPLTAIYGSSSTLLECYDHLPAEQSIQLVAGIREDSEWLIDMVENLLSVTKLDGGRLNLNVTDTSVEELIDVVLDKFHRRYPGQEIGLLMPDEFVSISMDPILIEQVCLNILENAMKHAKGMTELKVGIQSDGQFVTFSISDDGCGIEERVLAKLFKETIEQQTDTGQPERWWMKPFSGENDRQKQPIDGKRQGMGIGMYVCASIIEAHGGRISVENLKPGGCRFQFELRQSSSTVGESYG